MLKSRIKRREAIVQRMATRFTAVEAAILALDNEDLLDFADIFAGCQQTPLWEIASAEMQKRGLSL